MQVVAVMSREIPMVRNVMTNGLRIFFLSSVSTLIEYEIKAQLTIAMPKYNVGFKFPPIQVPSADQLVHT